ncbi:hypothetical protein AHAS_Ahas09G0127400 [Arachis hypogaea]
MKKSESLVARIIKAKYYSRTNFLKAPIGYTPSCTWRSILSAREVLELGVFGGLGMASQSKYKAHHGFQTKTTTDFRAQ